MLRSILVLVALAISLIADVMPAAEQRPGRGRQRGRDADNPTSEPGDRPLTDLSPAQRATIMGIVEDLRRRFPDRPVTPMAIGHRLQTVDQDLFALLDHNSSGTLEPHELPRRLWDQSRRQRPDDQAEAGQWRARVQTLRELHPGLAKLVSDDDGQIDPAALRQAWQRYQALLRRFDADGDGQLTGDELRLARPVIVAWLREHTELGPRRQARTPQDGDDPLRSDLKQGLIERYDRDGDGRLDAAERAAARAELEARLQQRLDILRRNHPDLFAEIDRDGDGVISPEELRQWRQQRRQEQRGPGRRQGQGQGQGQGRGRQPAEP